jgi:hypothetical protein
MPWDRNTVLWRSPKLDSIPSPILTHANLINAAKALGLEAQVMDGLKGWLETFANPFTAAMPEEMRSPFLDKVVATISPQLTNEAGQVFADYVRLRFAAIKY